MAAYALYRFPFTDTYARLVQHGEPLRLSSCRELDGRSGFVFAPFAVSTEAPILLLQPDEATYGLTLTASPDRGDDIAAADGARLTADSAEKARRERDDYAADFERFHGQLAAGAFKKIVLARSSEVVLSQKADAERLFFRACAHYPRMFIALVSTTTGGTWLLATPEVLLEGSGTDWQTMALAGTMRLGSAHRWSDKNIREQRYVATYIAECLRKFSNRVSEDGPKTVRAGQLVHLRSDFSFTLSSEDRVGELLEALHPTPAVGGIPKEEARAYIIYNEHAPRSYYSGFTGPLRLQGETHLYVSLRCMQLDGNHCRLHAGGGLLADSIMQKEWEETEAKMQTMRSLLDAEG